MNASTPDAPVSSPLLRREDLRGTPLEQFEFWLQQAARSAVAQPLAMSLATVGGDGRPLVRTVLLKYFDSEGFVFFTDVGSRKVRQMSENPQVSLLFPWIELNRQVVVSGRAGKLGTFEAVKCFLLGEQGGVTASAAVEMQLEELRQRLGSGVPLLAPSWVGYRVQPDSVEFFQGRGAREHDRFLYARGPDGGWTIQALD
ncbi:MAG: pyridoxal 5'-phosphate synthase [Limisphaerales bacterium]